MRVIYPDYWRKRKVISYDKRSYQKLRQVARSVKLKHSYRLPNHDSLRRSVYTGIMSERSQEWDLRSEEASLARGFVEPVSYFSPKLDLEY